MCSVLWDLFKTSCSCEELKCRLQNRKRVSILHKSPSKYIKPCLACFFAVHCESNKTSNILNSSFYSSEPEASVYVSLWIMRGNPTQILSFMNT